MTVLLLYIQILASYDDLYRNVGRMRQRYFQSTAAVNCDTLEHSH